jgi:hypothetical protein
MLHQLQAGLDQRINQCSGAEVTYSRFALSVQELGLCLGQLGACPTLLIEPARDKPQLVSPQPCTPKPKLL